MCRFRLEREHVIGNQLPANRVQDAARESLSRPSQISKEEYPLLGLRMLCCADDTCMDLGRQLLALIHCRGSKKPSVDLEGRTERKY